MLDADSAGKGHNVDIKTYASVYSVCISSSIYNTHHII